MQPADYDHPIPEYVVMSLVVLLIGTVLALDSSLPPLGRASWGFPAGGRIAADESDGLWHQGFARGKRRPRRQKVIPFLGTISIFVLLANLLSIFPEFSSPTVQPIVPLACAMLVFLYFNWQGIRHHGPIRYVLTFAGSPKHLGDWVLAVLLFPVEVISTLARLLSLTVRLWANIFASDLIYVIFLGFCLLPRNGPGTRILFSVWSSEFFHWLFRLCLSGLHIFVSVIQAYIFTVLPAIYVGLAVADEH